ncbi:limkain-b1 [Trifolium medium]|uniref:Limkain-b1 n=1 Tax=Trifolium medium TaxID=97028 RepID=A0A392QJ87_9FABA|nr:limkain-b1 [Trifolium medium]
MEENPFSSAKISVWWDIENCQVPRNFNPNTIAKNITSALFNSNFHGPLSISAYCDTTGLPFHVQQALSSTGVSLYHVPAGMYDSLFILFPQNNP